MVEHVWALHASLGEGPIWVDGILHFVDILAGNLYTYDPAAHELKEEHVAAVASFVAVDTQGHRLVGTAEGIGHLHDTAFSILQDGVTNDPAGRFNDAAVDRAGRLWAGTLSDKPENHLFRVDVNAAARVMVSGVGIANGIGWSPDNRVMYFTDSAINTIHAFEFHLESGEIANRRTFFQSAEGHGTPDGLTVDSEGHLWVAFWDGWCVRRIAPTGKIVQEIKLPVQRPTSCALGGDDLRTLYVTSARAGLTDEQLAEQAQAGDLFRIQVDVPGLPEPKARIHLPQM